MKKFFVLFVMIFIVWGCSMFGQSDVEKAPYELLKKDNNFEIRNYKEMILITTAMDSLDEQKSPFYRLFNYISGENKSEKEIPMTAPVFMDQNNGISETMSFVMPSDFSVETTPLPINEALNIEEYNNYTVAAITFSGPLDQDNIKVHSEALQEWMNKNGILAVGKPKAAGYNPPFTIPALRRNEILISIKKP